MYINTIQFASEFFSDPDIISKVNPCLHRFDIKFVFSKHTPGVKTPPPFGRFSFSVRIVVAASKRQTFVAPYAEILSAKCYVVIR